MTFKSIFTISLILFLSGLAFGQSQSTVLLEEFTEASCPPCEELTPALNALTDQNADKIVQIRCHTECPEINPMNADNPGEVKVRRSYCKNIGLRTSYLGCIMRPVLKSSNRMTSESINQIG